MSPDEIRQPTQAFSLRVLPWVQALAPSPVAKEVGRRPLRRAGAARGADDRAACCARAKADCVHQLQSAKEACDEARCESELLAESGWGQARRLTDWLSESTAPLALVGVSAKAARPAIGRGARQTSIANRP